MRDKNDLTNMISEKVVRMQRVTQIMGSIKDPRERIAYVKLITDIQKQINELREELEKLRNEEL